MKVGVFMDLSVSFPLLNFESFLVYIKIKKETKFSFVTKCGGQEIHGEINVNEKLLRGFQ